MSEQIGQTMYRWAGELFPICRSLTGDGVRETLRFIQAIIPDLQIIEVPSRTPAFDWTVPDEWNIEAAYVENEYGERIIDFRENNLHVVGYSEPIDAWMTLDELNEHLYSLPEQPDAVPYVTSYYARRWGFCLQDSRRRELKSGDYHVVIDATLEPGYLTYGEVIFPGQESREILLSTYVCHPSMANNELSGPVVATALAHWLSERKDRRFTYRIVFVPETIGSIVYLNRNLGAMKQNTVAGFVLTCMGDDRTWSLLHSRNDGTIADQVARHVLQHRVGSFQEYSFLERGSDERQYCSPGIDLPVVSIMRSKYGTYPEYHTSLDDLSLISPRGLGESYEIVRECLSVLEINDAYVTTVPCEPQMGKRGLYPTVSTRDSGRQVRTMMDILAYCDGTHDLLTVAERIGVYVGDCISKVKKLTESGVIRKVEAVAKKAPISGTQASR